MADINIQQTTPTINIDTATRNYHLPIASATTLGGIKVGTNLTIEEDGTLNAESTEYNLPAATTSTLGGIMIGSGLSINHGIASVDVDASLDPDSTNPVQNAVVTSNLTSMTSSIQEATSSITSISNSLGTLSSSVSTNTNNISTLQSTVSGHTTAISTNADNIANNTNAINDINGDISLLDNRLDTAEDAITSLENGATELTSDVTMLKHQVSETITNSYLLPVSTWSDGAIQLERRGKMATFTFDLTCTLSIHNTDVQIYTLTANIPNATTYSTLLSDDGTILCKIDDNGIITLMNPDGTNKTITHLYGQITVVYQ